MRVGGVAENLIDFIALRTGLAATPMLDTQFAMLLARTVMVATKLGVFEALVPRALTADEVASACRIHLDATKKLLNSLVGAGYLRAEDRRYALAPVARKWLLRDSPKSLRDNVLFRFIEWGWLEHYEEYIRTGVHLDIHQRLSDEEWQVHQRGMRSLANLWLPEMARRTPVPKGARDMLDIGGSHGCYSAALCRRHQGLRAVILELPEVVEQCLPSFDGEGLDGRVEYRAGDALTTDLGTDVWDFVFVASFAHHFDESVNREIARRVARALRPGGVFVIQDVIRQTSAGKGGQAGALLDLFFAATSAAGTWSFDEMAEWQRAAGLVPQKPIRFRTVPGTGQQPAVKPTG